MCEIPSHRGCRRNIELGIQKSFPGTSKLNRKLLVNSFKVKEFKNTKQNFHGLQIPKRPLNVQKCKYSTVLPFAEQPRGWNPTSPSGEPRIAQPGGATRDLSPPPQLRRNNRDFATLKLNNTKFLTAAVQSCSLMEEMGRKKSKPKDW